MAVVGVFWPSGMRRCSCSPGRFWWRRSGLKHDLAIRGVRTAGKPAAFLRGFPRCLTSDCYDCLILGWVTKAMVNISVFAGVIDGKALAICVFF